MKINKIYLYLFFWGLALDFKGAEEGGSYFQYLAFIITLFGGLAFLFKNNARDGLSKKSKRIGTLLIVNCVGSALYAVILNIEIGRHFRVALPTYLLIVGFYTGLRLRSIGEYFIVSAMLRGAIIAIVFNFLYGYLWSDVDLNLVRYKILSPMIFIAVPITAFYAFSVRRKVLLSSVLSIAILTLILIGATRSWLIAYFGVLIAAVIYRSAIESSALRSVMSGAITTVFMVSSVLFMSNFLFPDIVLRMVERFMSYEETGFDITTATRLAEIHYQLTGWLSSPLATFLGNGVGASYGFSGAYADLVSDLLGESGLADDWWFAGHNFWVYSLFSQGLLGGLIIPVLLVYCLYISVKGSINRGSISKSKRSLRYERTMFILLSLFFTSFILSTIGGNLIGSRMFSQYVGVCIGMVFALNFGADSSTNRNVEQPQEGG